MARAGGLARHSTRRVDKTDEMDEESSHKTGETQRMRRSAVARPTERTASPTSMSF